MKKDFEDKFLDYIDGTLSEEEKLAFEKALESDAELKKSFEDYKKVISTERIINMQKHELNANFSVKVMDRIENERQGFFRRLFMEMSLNKKSFAGAFATLAILIFVVQFYRMRPDDFGSLKRAENAMQPARVAEPAPILAKPLEDTKKDGDKAPAVPQQQFKMVGKELANEAELEKRQDIPKVLERDENKLQVFEELRKKAEQAAIPHGVDMAAVDKSNSRPVTAFKVELGSVEGAAPPPSRVTVDDLLGRQNYNDTESYTAYEENPRIEVRKEPSSTFGIDVDTASYTNTRRFLKEGRLPAKDSVRIEEFLNYFDYKYPEQYDKPFSLSYEIAPSPLEKDRYLLKLGVKARDKKETGKPWNLVFLVDVSGSMMDTNKLPLVQRSLRLLTENMKEGDKVAIVTYAGNAGTVLESTTIKEKAKILSAIDSLSAGGSTNGSGGITAAYEVALKNKIDGAVNRVVLATDGDFNVGVTSQDELIRLIEEKRKSGITLTTLGFGTGNIKDGTMEQLANKGNGNYYYIDSFKEARKVLETDLAGTMEVVAKDVKLQIEFNPEHVQSYRLIGYENRKLKQEDFNNDAIDAGEIGTGHTVTAMYEIVLANSPLAQKMNDEYRYQDKETVKKEVKDTSHSGELAFLKIRYKEPEGSQSSLLSFPIDKANVKDSVDNESIDFKFAAAVSYFAHILRDSSFKGNYTYKDIATLAESAKGEDKNGYRQEFIELVKDAASIR